MVEHTTSRRSVLKASGSIALLGGAAGLASAGSLSVGTDSATNVTANSATLNGTLYDLGGHDTVYVRFEWGDDPDQLYSHTDYQQMSSTGSFSDEITGLDSGTTYYFRAWAEDEGSDIDTGTTLSFTTDTVFTVSTDGATSVGETSATLNGSLDELDGAASADVYFEWRQTGAPGWNATSTQTLSSTGSFSDSISGLASDTEYEYRAVGDASDGDSDTGSTVTFTTDSSSGGGGGGGGDPPEETE